MLAKATDMIGRTIRAADGDIGMVMTLYFDDDRWAIRYLIVDTGRWLPGRQVLISPAAITQPVFKGKSLDSPLTCEQVRHSPDVSTEPPISRQHERALAEYYGYPSYWIGPGASGMTAATAAMPATRDTGAGSSPPEAEREHDERSSHLRDFSEVQRYHIQAANGSVGRVEDFIVDTERWIIRYIVADTGQWIGSRRVLVAPEWVTGISWEKSALHVAMTREAVRESPEYDPARHLLPNDEQRLHSHYSRSPYWFGIEDRATSSNPDSVVRGRIARLEQFEDFEVAEGNTDVRGWKVAAADGVIVGRVEHLIVDPDALKVRYLEIGLESRHANGTAGDVLVPIEYVDIDVKAKEVQLRTLASARLAALPLFNGLPVNAEFIARTRAHFIAPIGPCDREPAESQGRGRQ